MIANIDFLEFSISLIRVQRAIFPEPHFKVMEIDFWLEKGVNNVFFLIDLSAITEYEVVSYDIDLHKRGLNYGWDSAKYKTKEKEFLAYLVELGRCRLSDELNLEKNMILELNSLAGNPLKIFIDGTECWTCEALCLDDSKAVRINEMSDGQFEFSDDEKNTDEFYNTRVILGWTNVSKKEADITLEKKIVPLQESRARFFPTTGGILKTLTQQRPDYTYMALDGVENCMAALRDIEAGKVHKCFIESLNSTYRKLNRQRSVFPSDTALLKALYLATFEATKKWTISIRNWGQVYGELSIMYEGRLPE